MVGANDGQIRSGLTDLIPASPHPPLLSSACLCYFWPCWPTEASGPPHKILPLELWYLRRDLSSVQPHLPFHSLSLMAQLNGFSPLPASCNLTTCASSSGGLVSASSSDPPTPFQCFVSCNKSLIPLTLILFRFSKQILTDTFPQCLVFYNCTVSGVSLFISNGLYVVKP